MYHFDFPFFNQIQRMIPVAENKKVEIDGQDFDLLVLIVVLAGADGPRAV